MDSFIEHQFPVSKVSKESYKERKANLGQTLTGLGKWWGRKPLVLVRAAILGCLLPAGPDTKKDMDIFLKLMSMDPRGLLRRRKTELRLWAMLKIALKDPKLSPHVDDWFVCYLRDTGTKSPASNYKDAMVGEGIALRDGVDEMELKTRIFSSLGYDRMLEECVRPEELENLDAETWREINEYCGTSAANLQEFVQQMSVKRFGHNVRVGDCFCGGGSIPFEAARLGCDTYASDLNPIAGLLTWASINICGASEEELAEIRKFQQEVYDKVDAEITKLGVEHNELGDRAVSYLYCVETKCPECGWKVPLAPSWVIGKGTGTVAILREHDGRYDIDVKMSAKPEEMKAAEESGTVTSRGLVCPHCGKTTPISVLRGDRLDENGKVVYGLRQWEKSEFEFRPDDVYGERLYAIKYEKHEPKKKHPTRYYRAPNERDLRNEVKVRQIVADNIVSWQEHGLVPSMAIESGQETDKVMRTRGWTHWNHLFNARQLLIHSMMINEILTIKDKDKRVVSILGINKILDWDSKLCMWDASPASEKIAHTFSNQALNTIFNFPTRGVVAYNTPWFFNINLCNIKTINEVMLLDARNINKLCDFWVTDPPYADAINYHELSEFFLAWDKRLLQETFPDWYTDSKRVLAIKGDEHFSQSMIEIYKNLADHMSYDGLQIVMFTHSDPAVWAQLALIMWKAGLRVTAAWNVATETDASGLKSGNYVKGTVLLVLRKQTQDETAFLDEIISDIKGEVQKQIKSMQELEDREEPNFSDPDYVLAAYAASLKVLTSYKEIGELNLDRELDLAIHEPAKSRIVDLIERAKKIAYDCIIPFGFESWLWRDLGNAERFYIKALEAEKHGNHQISTYQEYARGFAIGSYGQLMASERANNARLKTPVEFAMRTVSDLPDFEKSTLRTVLAAIHIGIKEDNAPDKGLAYIKQTLPDYWNSREKVIQLLAFLKDTGEITGMEPWKESAEMADHLFVLVDNDHV